MPNAPEPTDVRTWGVGLVPCRTRMVQRRNPLTDGAASGRALRSGQCARVRASGLRGGVPGVDGDGVAVVWWRPASSERAASEAVEAAWIERAEVRTYKHLREEVSAVELLARKGAASAIGRFAHRAGARACARDGAPGEVWRGRARNADGRGERRRPPGGRRPDDRCAADRDGALIGAGGIERGRVQPGRGARDGA